MNRDELFELFGFLIYLRDRYLINQAVEEDMINQHILKIKAMIDKTVRETFPTKE